MKRLHIMGNKLVRFILSFTALNGGSVTRTTSYCTLAPSGGHEISNFSMLTQEFCWVRACVEWWLSKQLIYRDEVGERKVKFN